MHPKRNSDNSPELKQTVADLLHGAKQAGASQAEIMVSQESGFSLTVRKGEVETLEHHRGKGLSLSVYFGNRVGSATSSDLSSEALRITLEKACNIARFTEEDPYSGLADPELMAYQYPDLDLYHPWNILPEQAIELARECEALARDSDKRITNSEGANLSTHTHYHIYGNSHGFIGDYATSYHSMSCALIAQDGHEMECDSDYTCSRNAQDLLAVKTLAKSAALKTVQRLGAQRLTTQQAPIIFKADVARGLIASFFSAISGGSLYRKASFLLDSLHQPIFPSHIRIDEQPHLLQGIGSSPFDSEGVRTQARDFIKDGILQNYLLGSYSARKLGMQTTGNADGVHNVFISHSDIDLAGLMKTMGTGLLVTDLMGQGVNMVTGDYSRGAFGYWVENGEIQYPVTEITIAGNLKEMFSNLVR